jgi:hypothetical protein
MAASSDKKPKVPLCFVVGPIGKEGSLERKHADLLLHSVIKHVLEGEKFGYKVKRADEDADPGMIGDRVISDIIHAELVVADLTDLNPNAFYELGIRHSTEKPTIHIAKAGTVLPFDTVAHRTIFVDLTDWQSTEAGRLSLARFALAIKDPEYKVSNPITQANASFKMRESSDPQVRVIAELQERVGTLEARSQAPPRNPVHPPRSNRQELTQNIKQIIYSYLTNHKMDQITMTRTLETVNNDLKQIKPTLEIRYVPDVNPDHIVYELFDDDQLVERYVVSK